MGESYRVRVRIRGRLPVGSRGSKPTELAGTPCASAVARSIQRMASRMRLTGCLTRGCCGMESMRKIRSRRKMLWLGIGFWVFPPTS